MSSGFENGFVLTGARFWIARFKANAANFFSHLPGRIGRRHVVRTAPADESDHCRHEKPPDQDSDDDLHALSTLNSQLTTHDCLYACPRLEEWHVISLPHSS